MSFLLQLCVYTGQKVKDLCEEGLNASLAKMKKISDGAHELYILGLTSLETQTFTVLTMVIFLEYYGEFFLNIMVKLNSTKGRRFERVFPKKEKDLHHPKWFRVEWIFKFERGG